MSSHKLQPRTAWNSRTWVLRATATAALVVLTGCATLPDGRQPAEGDPWEGYNRSMSQFNDRVDAAVMRPAATAYQAVLPSPVRTGVSNFFANLGDVWSFVNNVLQLRAEGAAHSFMRVGVNTFMGIGGVLDIASEIGIDRHKQDFGQTLGRWGVGTGPYLVLPILGPSTLRDTAALPVDWRGNLVGYVTPVSDRNVLYALNAVSTREGLLQASRVLDGAALDKYSFTRDVYLQVRRQSVQPPKATVDEQQDSNEGVLPQEPER